MLRSRAATAVAVLATLLAGPTVGAAAPVALDVELRARALAPGEPVRIVVTTPEPLESAGSSFLGTAVFLVEETADRWTGWSMVPLDHEPGLTTVDVRGATADGRTALGTVALAVVAKDFPREELSVASRYVKPPDEVEARLARERRTLSAIYETRSPRPSLREPFVRPVPGTNTSVFGTRRIFNGEPRSPHPGLDLRAPEGTPVGASGPGRVVMAEDLYYSGNTVVVDHGGGLYTLYAHLSAIRVDEGAEVTAGQVVGLSGSTGRVTGPHLHWGAKIGDRPFDPEALLDATLFR